MGCRGRVPDVGRNLALFVGALAGALAGLFLRRRRPPELAPGPDPRAEELRQRLATARAVAPENTAESSSAEPAPELAAPPADEFDAMRRRVHAEGRAAAEEMRRSAEDAGKSD